MEGTTEFRGKRLAAGWTVERIISEYTALAQGGPTQVELADECGLTKAQVSDILKDAGVSEKTASLRRRLSREAQRELKRSGYTKAPTYMTYDDVRVLVDQMLSHRLDTERTLSTSIAAMALADAPTAEMITKIKNTAEMQTTLTIVAALKALESTAAMITAKALRGEWSATDSELLMTVLDRGTPLLAAAKR